MAVFVRRLFGIGELPGDGCGGSLSPHHRPAIPTGCIVRAAGVTDSP